MKLKSQFENVKDIKQRNQIKADLLKIAEHQERTRQKIEDLETLDKLKKKAQIEKIRSKNDVVESNNHIDKPYFDSDFNGFRDLFVGMFGN